MNYDKFLESSRKRAAEVLVMRERGDAFSVIGKRFGISPQRAQQIFKAVKSLTTRSKG